MTASRCRSSVSEYLGILDPWIATIVDLEADDALTEYENEKQAQLFEALGLGAMTNQLPPELQVRQGPRRIRQ